MGIRASLTKKKISRPQTFGRKKGTPRRSRKKKFWRSFLIQADFIPLIPNWGVILKVRSLTKKKIPSPKDRPDGDAKPQFPAVQKKAGIPLVVAFNSQPISFD